MHREDVKLAEQLVATLREQLATAEALVTQTKREAIEEEIGHLEAELVEAQGWRDRIARAEEIERELTDLRAELEDLPK